MTPVSISEQIINTRQEKAPLLERIMADCRIFREKIGNVYTALNLLNGLDGPDGEIRDELAALGKEIAAFESRVNIRHERFRSGLITVAIAGLEKAGKTTFLKSLTGIGALPAFDERCTAVCCEIHYSRERYGFDLEFYSSGEFLDRVVRPVMETIAQSLPEALRPAFVPPSDAGAFAALTLPPQDVLPGGTTAFKLLNDLRRLQACFSECRQYLDRPPLTGQMLPELGEWVSHRSAAQNLNKSDDRDLQGRHIARIAAAKLCRVYADFPGGSPHLRWIDTPGVDDPNRRARELTLATIAEDADLLVVASRPGATPSPGESFHNFWDSVSRQPDEIRVMDRMLFALNQDRRVDPDGENIRIHQKYLMDAGVPRHIFAGPFEAIKPEDAARLMETVNAHLKRHLPEQDEEAVREYQNRLKNIAARIRLLHDRLAASHPSDAGLHDLETEEFHKWFRWYRDGRETGFWTDLISALDRAAREIPEDPRIQASESSLNAIFVEEAEKIQEAIPSPEILADHVVRFRGENPVPSAMRELTLHFSRLVNRLASEVQEFGPIMQDKLTQVFTEAGLGPLMDGENAGEKMSALLDRFAGVDAGPDNAVLELLRETLELPRNLKYVIRYELRPSVDFCDPTLWNPEEDAWTRIMEMVKGNGGDTARLARFDTHKYPPVNDSREKDHAVLRKIAGNAMLAVHTALNNERYLPRRIADDFMRDCRVRLCFGPASEQEWRTLLFRTRGTLLSRTIGHIRARSERVRTFRQALAELERGLP